MAGTIIKPNQDVPLDALCRPGTHDVDARGVASYLGISLERLLAKAVKGKASQISRDPASPAIQLYLQSIRRILEILEEVFPRREQVLAWLNRAHVDLGGRTPVEVILLGYPNAVRDMLEAALIGSPS